MTNRLNMYQTANLALALGLMTLAPSLANAQPRCESLNGTYAFAFSSTITLPGPPAITAQWYGIGIMTFDGTGNLTALQTTNFPGGPVLRNVPLSGSYILNPDCTGTMIVKFPNFPDFHSDFVIADNFKTIYSIGTDVRPAGNSIASTFTKIR